MDRIFKQLGISCKYYLAEHHTKGGLYGCFDSHIKVWKKFFRNDSDYLVIFEDDLEVPSNLSPQEFRRIIQAGPSLLKKYDIVHYGRQIHDICGVVAEIPGYQFYEGTCVQSHFYIISKNFQKKASLLKPYLSEGISVDEAIKDKCKQVFLYPNVFPQRDMNDSDITTNKFLLLRRKYEKYCARPIEFYQTHFKFFSTN